MWFLKTVVIKLPLIFISYSSKTKFVITLVYMHAETWKSVVYITLLCFYNLVFYIKKKNKNKRNTIFFSDFTHEKCYYSIKKIIPP